MSITVPTNFSTGSFLNASQPLEYNSSTNTLYLNNAISNIVSTLTGATNNTLCTSLGTKTYIDNLIQGIVWVNPIKNFWDFTTPPSSPSVGDAYISSTTSGTYLLNYIYTWNGTVWVASKPDLYWTMYNESNNEIVIWNGTSYVVIASGLATAFIELTDCPNSYSTAGAVPVINSGATGLVFSPTTTIQNSIISDSGATSLSVGSSVSGTKLNLFAGGTPASNSMVVLNSSTSNVSIPVATSSTSTATGALTVVGGLGVGGNEYISGIINCSNTTASTSSITGAIICSGGIGISGSSNIGGNETLTGYLNITNTTASTSSTTGAMICSGGIGISGNNYLGGITNITNATASSTTATGALVLTAGGLGVNGAVNIGGATGIAGITTVSNASASTSSTSGALIITGGVGVSGNNYLGGITNITNATASSTTATGALVLTAGGLGVNGAVNIGGATGIAGITTVSNASASTSSTSGALIITGGVGVSGNNYLGGITNITNATASSTTATGALVLTAGGLGVNGAVNIGGATGIAGITTVSNASASTSSTSGALIITGGIGASGNNFLGGITAITNATATPSTSSTAGALLVSGGIGCNGNIYSASTIYAAGFGGTGSTNISVPSGDTLWFNIAATTILQISGTTTSIYGTLNGLNNASLIFNTTAASKTISLQTNSSARLTCSDTAVSTTQPVYFANMGTSATIQGALGTTKLSWRSTSTSTAQYTMMTLTLSATTYNNTLAYTILGRDAANTTIASYVGYFFVYAGGGSIGGITPVLQATYEGTPATVLTPIITNNTNFNMTYSGGVFSLKVTPTVSTQVDLLVDCTVETF